MKKVHFILFAVIAVSCFTACNNTKPVVTMVPPIAPDPVSFHEYFARRVNLAQRSPAKVAYLLKSADNASAALYRQEANFLYFTGICKSPCFLLIAPHGTTVDGNLFMSVFFTRDTLLLQERAHFESHGEAIVHMRRFNEIMKSVYPAIDTLYASIPEIPSRYTDWLNDERPDLLQLSAVKLRKQHPRLEVKPFRSIGSMRQVKSGAEIDNIRHAIAITNEAMHHMWRACAPGVRENDLQGIMHYLFAKYDAREYAFYPIIGTGVNGLEPHYMDNNAVTKDGDMMVVDMGARFHGYCADITRSFPVSGKFTPEQREAYNTLLDIQKKVIESVRPGISIGGINRLSDRLMKEAGYLKYRLHGMCHHLGMEVHDFETDTILRPGHVITIEPGLYFPANATELPAGFRGMGLRIEDDLLVTTKGYQVLSDRIPKEIDEIEAAMRKP